MRSYALKLSIPGDCVRQSLYFPGDFMCGGSGGSKSGGGGGGYGSDMPNVPQDASTMTKAQQKEVVNWLVKNKTYDQLRSAQRITVQQTEMASKKGDTKTVKNLDARWKLYTSAIDKQAFG